MAVLPALFVTFWDLYGIAFKEVLPEVPLPPKGKKADRPDLHEGKQDPE